MNTYSTKVKPAALHDLRSGVFNKASMAFHNDSDEEDTTCRDESTSSFFGFSMPSHLSNNERPKPPVRQPSMDYDNNGGPMIRKAPGRENSLDPKSIGLQKMWQQYDRICNSLSSMSSWGSGNSSASSSKDSWSSGSHRDSNSYILNNNSKSINNKSGNFRGSSMISAETLDNSRDTWGEGEEIPPLPSESKLLQARRGVRRAVSSSLAPVQELVRGSFNNKTNSSILGPGKSNGNTTTLPSLQQQPSSLRPGVRRVFSDHVLTTSTAMGPVSPNRGAMAVPLRHPFGSPQRRVTPVRQPSLTLQGSLHRTNSSSKHSNRSLLLSTSTHHSIHSINTSLSRQDSVQSELSFAVPLEEEEEEEDNNEDASRTPMAPISPTRSPTRSPTNRSSRPAMIPRTASGRIAKRSNSKRNLLKKQRSALQKSNSFNLQQQSLNMQLFFSEYDNITTTATPDIITTSSTTNSNSSNRSLCKSATGW